MSLVTYINRKNTDCIKYDNMLEMFNDESLLPMWIADMDFKAPEASIHALSDYVNEGVFGYYKVPDSYYEAFINWEEKQHNFKVDKEWLRFSPGVVSGFHWIVQFMTNPGDAVIVLKPVYYPFYNAINNNNRKLITSELVIKGETFTINFEDFENKIVENNVKLFILCSPHNPVGRVWKQEELKRLLDICRKHNVFVISDEIHHDLVYANHKHLPSLSIGDYDDMMIAITAPSKTFNLATCQNSIVIIPNEDLRNKWDTYANQIHVLTGNSFGYIAAQAAYQHGLPWLTEVKEIIYENYQYMKKALKETLPEIIVYPLEGTYLSWVDFSAYVSADQLIDFLQNKCKIAVDYGEWFGGAEYGSFARINLATSRENVEAAVNAIIANIKDPEH